MNRTRPGSLVSAPKAGLTPLQPANVIATERRWKSDGCGMEGTGRGGAGVQEEGKMGYVNLREGEREREEGMTTKSRAEPSEGCKRGGKGGWGEAEGARELARSQRMKAILSLSTSPPHTPSLSSSRP